MHANTLSDDLSIDLVTHDLNSRSFLMFLRREDERYRELSTSQNNRQYPSKYSSFDNSRGLARINKYNYLSSIPSYMISEDGVKITDDLSNQLLDDNLSIVRRHWKKSKMEFSNKIGDIQSDLNSHMNMSVKKGMCGCQAAIFNWISKNRLK